jgi:hypothetical protein
MDRPEHPKVGDKVPVKPGSMPIMFYFKPTAFEFIDHAQWKKLMKERVGVEPASVGPRGGYTVCVTGGRPGSYSFDD